MSTFPAMERTSLLAMGQDPVRTVPMAMIVPILVVACLAFAIWLGVRIVNRRERWAKRLAVGVSVGLPSLYLLSFGPAVWLTARGYDFGRSLDGRMGFVESFYSPILRSVAPAPSLPATAVQWWGSLGVPDDESVSLTVDLGDSTMVLEFPESLE